MKSFIPVILLVSTPLWAVDTVNPENPKLFRQQHEIVEKELKTLKVLPAEIASGLYRSWINPVKSVKTPANQTKDFPVISPSVRNPALEQTFFKSKEWKPGKIVHVYEISKDFDAILNPLSLKDFNRFIYKRNSSSP